MEIEQLLAKLRCHYYLANTIGSYFSEVAKTIDTLSISPEEAENYQVKYLVDNPIITTSADFTNCFYLIVFALSNNNMVAAKALINENMSSGIRWISRATKFIEQFSRPIHYRELNLGHAFMDNQISAQFISTISHSSTQIKLIGDNHD